MQVVSRVALVIAASAVFAPALAAQAKVTAAAGLAMPIGSTADAIKMGYNATIGLEIKPPLAPLGVRVEGLFNQFDGKTSNIGTRLLAGAVSATLSGAGMPIPMGYLIGGVGIYNFKATNLPSGFTSTSSSKVGFNIGVGLNFPLTGFGAYAEARLHIVSSDPSTKFIPITFGVKF